MAALLIISIIVGSIHFLTRERIIEKDIIYLKNGNFILADNVWGNGKIVYYKNNNKTDMVLKTDVDQVKANARQETVSYKKTIMQYYGVKKEQLVDYLSLKQSEKSFIFFGLTKIFPGIIILILMASAYKILAVLLYNLHESGKNKQDDFEDSEKNLDFFKINEQKLNDIERIAYYFLKLYKKQLNVPEKAPADFYPADAGQSVSKSIFELRVRQNKAWSKRRITITRTGQDSSSKSKCFYVIYDIHMVIKIPPQPIDNFDLYLKNIKKEKAVIDILAPRECIVPMISVIMRRFHTFPGESLLPAEKLEEKYIQWVSRYPKHQEHLKINGSFVYFMNLSKYFFLGHILKKIYSIKPKMEREITGQPELVWNLDEFEGKYGISDPPVCVGIQILYTKCKKKVEELTAGHIKSPIPEYQLRKWFLLHLADKAIPDNEDGIPPELSKPLNRLLTSIFKADYKDVESYRKTIRNYAINISFAQNKLQIRGIVTNMLDLLSWLREKGVAMRDLKPDNLIVAGDQSDYPAFLMSPEKFSIGLIDVETSVFFKKNKAAEIAQPQLGGTPYYATPSQLLTNEILISTFQDLPRILHLQDWFATAVIIFQTVTGEQLFEKTVRLFPEMIKKIQTAGNSNRRPEAIVYEISRLFWTKAATEFKEKTARKKLMLKAINVALPQQVRKMLSEEIQTAVDNNKKNIKYMIESHKIFKSQKIRKQLLSAPPAKIRALKFKWEQGTPAKLLSPDDKLKINKLLQDLEFLKTQRADFTQLRNSIKQPEIKVQTDVLLEIIFKIVYTGMFQEKWGISLSLIKEP